MKNKIINVHPGEILSEEFLIPMEITAYRLSKETGIPESVISEIINGKRNITAQISLKLGKFFEVNSKFWLGLQNDFDLRNERYKLGKDLSKIKSFRNFYKLVKNTKKTPSLA